MKCTLCGYEFPYFDWEAKETMQEQVERTQKKVSDHWKRDHRDVIIFLSWYLERFTEKLYHSSEQCTNSLAIQGEKDNKEV